MSGWRRAAAALLESLTDERRPPQHTSPPKVVVERAPPISVGAVAVPVVAPATAIPVVVQRVADLVVSEVPRAVWDSKGWERRPQPGGALYVGAYEAAPSGGAVRRFRGRIEHRGHRIDAYVADPPESIRRHPKGPCFALVDGGLFKLHWHRSPRNVDNAILYVERVLAEALGR